MTPRLLTMPIFGRDRMQSFQCRIGCATKKSVNCAQRRYGIHTSCGKPTKAIKAKARETREAAKKIKISKVAKAAENRLSSRTQNKVDEKPKKLKVAGDESQTNKQKVSKLQHFQAVVDEAESRKQKFSSDIYQKAKALAESLPRGITVRPSGKWVSNSFRFS